MELIDTLALIRENRKGGNILFHGTGVRKVTLATPMSRWVFGHTF